MDRGRVVDMDHMDLWSNLESNLDNRHSTRTEHVSVRSMAPVMRIACGGPISAICGASGWCCLGVRLKPLAPN